MEGVGDEVLLFGAATVVAAIMLYYAVKSKFPRILVEDSTWFKVITRFQVGHMFSLVAPPGGSTEDQISATDGM